MLKSEIYNNCSYRLEQLLREHKLKIKTPICEPPQRWFAWNKHIYTGIVISTIEGEAGIITRVWGVVFVDNDKTFRCTDVHTSFYSDSIALEKLSRELNV